MRNVWTIARREYRAYFSSPVAYVVAFAIMLVLGIVMSLGISASIQQPGSAPGMETVAGILYFMLIFSIPAITMRLLTEETRLGTIELLLTLPVRDGEIIVGKWLGAFLFVFSVIALSFVYPVLLNSIVQPGIDQGQIITGYAALALFSAAFVSIGILISSLFSNQVASFIATVGTFIVVWFLFGAAAQFVPGPVADVIRYMDVQTRFFNMVRGVVELSDIVYYLSFTIFFLMLSTVSLESRRWR